MVLLVLVLVVSTVEVVVDEEALLVDEDLVLVLVLELEINTEELSVGYDPAPELQDGPEMANGKLYWKVSGLAAEVILMP